MVHVPMGFQSRFVVLEIFAGGVYVYFIFSF